MSWHNSKSWTNTFQFLASLKLSYCKIHGQVRLNIACVAGRRKGMRKVKMSAGSEGEGTACKDAIVFFVFYVHQTNVKILIGQI